jgi:phage terminase Nu1 subunit (DNA packaging protein)
MTTPQKIKRLRHLKRRKDYNSIKMERVKAARVKIDTEISKILSSIPSNDRDLYRDPLKKLV